MNHILYTSIIGTAAGIIGTGLGGAIGFLLNNPSRRFLSALLNFSAGLMIAVVCFDLLPEAYEIGGFTAGVTGVVLVPAAVFVTSPVLAVTVADLAEVEQKIGRASCRERVSFLV